MTLSPHLEPKNDLVFGHKEGKTNTEERSVEGKNAAGSGAPSEKTSPEIESPEPRSTTAAQFLQRFILNKTPWAHLDIAGMAFSKYGGALNSRGATGFGVRLLSQLIEENYE